NCTEKSPSIPQVNLFVFQAGFLATLVVAEHAGEFEKIIQLLKRFPGFISPCLGIHPIPGTAPESQRGTSTEDHAINWLALTTRTVCSVSQITHEYNSTRSSIT
uniref:Glycolipid transfer protein domain-containing protein n=1 Tax=Esox lucius TaxID=8010 RepID=A0AAY5KX89_ESOLU